MSRPHPRLVYLLMARCFARLGVRRSLLLLLTALSAWQVGCASGGSGRLQLSSSERPGLRLKGRFDQAVYRYESPEEATVLLTQGPPERPDQAALIRVFWLPKAGRTPVDPNATNATITFLIFSGRQVGVYAGAGFVFPKSKPGKDPLKLRVWDATLQLTDRSERFEDLLGSAYLSGKLRAKRDEAATTRRLNRINALLEQRLGYQRPLLPPSLPGATGAASETPPHLGGLFVWVER